MAIALIVAAGRGERLGTDVPKAFVPLAGRPMIEWSVRALRSVGTVERIVVALPPGATAPEGTVGVPGGAVRSASVRAALGAAGPGEPVLVHDAARPLVTAELARSALRALDQDGGWDAAVCAAAMTDTVKQTAGRGTIAVTTTLDRSALWRVQTPQVFRRRALEEALNASEAELAAASDDAWLLECRGARVRIVVSPPENLKVTTPIDLRVAELLLAERDSRRQAPC